MAYQDQIGRIGDQERGAGAQLGASVGPCRQRADTVLLEEAERLERRARGLRVLAGLIPREGLSGEAEAAIWEAATRLR